jgi:Lipocalin-like domain
MNPLIGSWRLVSMEYRYTDGRVRYPYGRAASGYILYAADGRMSATIMGGGRAPFGGDFGRGAALAEKAAAFETALAYAGRYEFLGDRVLHHVEVSLVPDWAGTTLERLIDLQGDRLVLSNQLTTLNGRTRTTIIVWERVGASQ